MPLGRSPMVRRSVQPSNTPLARSTIVTRRSTVVLHRQIGHPADREHSRASELVGYPFLHVLLDAVQRHWWQKLAVGEMREAFGLSAHSNEAFDVIVPRRDVG